ncbi:MAG: DUF5606 domain-containing protein [Prevotellaceae bacterium]|jgi:hypothetical protein|nr:DUF5606 domain-containing protein [Prevotellaceae bacterium]
MLKTILSISGKPGLYKLVSQGKNMLIVESVSDKKRMPVHNTDKVISLGDITMFTDTDDIALKEVLAALRDKENGAPASIDPKKAGPDELRAFFATIVPHFDRDRVHPSDIKKLISWYNLLVSGGITNFEEEETTPSV